MAYAAEGKQVQYDGYEGESSSRRADECRASQQFAIGNDEGGKGCIPSDGDQYVEDGQPHLQLPVFVEEDSSKGDDGSQQRDGEEPPARTVLLPTEDVKLVGIERGDACGFPHICAERHTHRGTHEGDDEQEVGTLYALDHDASGLGACPRGLLKFLFLLGRVAVIYLAFDVFLCGD